ncbi:MAG: hypothetical protein WBX25_33740 [Rhodomicrobium sp.]
MTAIASYLSAAELETRYETAADPVAKSHFHAIWLQCQTARHHLVPA